MSCIELPAAVLAPNSSAPIISGFISHTKVNGEFTFRFVIGNTYVTRRNVIESWNYISLEAEKYFKNV